MRDEERSPEKMSIARLVANLKIGQLWAVGGVGVTLLSGTFGLGYTINSWIAKGEIAEAISQTTEVDGKSRALEKDLGELQETHEKLKVKENVLRLFHFYNIAKLDKQRVASEAALARQELKNLFPFSAPSTVRVTSSAARLEQRRRKDAYEKKKDDYYQEVDADSRKSIDDARALLATAEAELGRLSDVTDKRGDAIRDLLYSQEEKSQHMQVTYANITKGRGGTGTIKVAYDGMELAIPNEFLPVAAH